MVNYIVLAFLLFIYKKHNLYLNINYNLCQTGVSIDDCNYPTIYSSNICYNFLQTGIFQCGNYKKISAIENIPLSIYMFATVEPP